MTDVPTWAACRYADVRNEEGWCASGCDHLARRASDSGLHGSPASKVTRPSEQDSGSSIGLGAEGEQ